MYYDPSVPVGVYQAFQGVLDTIELSTALMMLDMEVTMTQGETRNLSSPSVLTASVSPM